MVKLNLLLILVALLSGCSSMHNIKTLSKQEVTESYTHKFDAPYNDVLNATTEAISKLGWTTKKVSETTEGVSGDEIFLFLLAGFASLELSDDEGAWKSVEPPKSATKITFIQARTSGTLISFGANIYVTIYTDGNSVDMKLSASTSQIVEKKKLPEYLNTIYSEVKSML